LLYLKPCTFRRHYAYPEDLACALAFGSVPLSAAAQQTAEPEPNGGQDCGTGASGSAVAFANTRYRGTYIQKLRPDKDLGAVPDGDKYFLGRAELAKGVELEPLIRVTGIKHMMLASLGKLFRRNFSHVVPANDLRGHEWIRTASITS